MIRKDRERNVKWKEVMRAKKRKIIPSRFDWRS